MVQGLLPGQTLEVSPLRLLWLSNSPRAATGYGNQTMLFTPRIKAAGHDIAILSFYGIEGSPTINSWGITEFPRFIEPYGNDAVGETYVFHRAQAVITLIDPFVLWPQVYEQLNWIAWSPIDSDPIFPPTAGALKSAKRIWAMSRYGEGKLKDAGFVNVDYVPHGVDSNIYQPRDKAAALARLKADAGIDLAGKFVVSMNSANKGAPSRKGFFEAFAAFAMFSEQHPDAVMYAHTEPNGFHNGENLPTLMEMVGLAKNKVIFAPQFHYTRGMLPPSYLADIYNVSDVLLHTSHGGGFEIPLVEAQMSGCPVIVTDFSAMPELVAAGWKVPGVPFMHAPGATQRLPIIPKVIEALEASYQKRDDGAFRAQARAGVMMYDADAVFENYMKPAIAKIDADLKQAAAKAAEVEDKRKAQRESLRQKTQAGVDKVNGNGHNAGTPVSMFAPRPPSANGHKKKAKKRKHGVRA